MQNSLIKQVQTNEAIPDSVEIGFLDPKGIIRYGLFRGWSRHKKVQRRKLVVHPIGAPGDRTILVNPRCRFCFVAS
jgi:hypothetical protein